MVTRSAAATGTTGEIAGVLVDTAGRPLRSSLTSSNGNGRSHDFESLEKSFASTISGYVESLSRLDLPPLLRARDPFQNHAWVSAAAIAVAFVSSQAPFLVFRETDRARNGRALATKAAGRSWIGPRAGTGRRAVERYLRRSMAQRFLMIGKAAEPDFDHPLMRVLSDPNPLLNGSQLMQLTMLWLAIRGEFYWLPVAEDGEPSPFGEEPAELWPIPPDCVEEEFAGGRERGDFSGFWITAPTYLPSVFQRSRRFFLEPGSLIQFKFPDPSNPIRGLSRLTAAAGAIESDFYARAHNRGLLKNGAEPRGVFEFEGVLNKQSEEEIRTKFKERHEKVENRGTIPILGHGLKWKTTGLSPADLQYLEGMRWNREEVLALLGAHKSILGVTEDLNYATQRAATANFWEMTIIPNMRIVEQTLDRSLFFPTTDDTFGMFDVSGVDALRAGLQEKIDQADKLAQERLHVPPREAYKVVGLDVPEYEGDDTALVSALATPYSVAVNLAENPLPPPPPPTAPPGPPDEEDDESAVLRPQRAPAAVSTKQTAAQRRRRWLRFVRVQGKLEGDMARRYRSWVAGERNATLERFDREARRLGAVSAALRRVAVMKELSLTAILPDPRESGRALKEKTRPNRAASLEASFQFTLEDIGIPTFAIDDAALMRFFDLRERIFAGSVPVTVRENLFSSLQAGIQAGETVQQLRSRIAEVYQIAAGTPKTLMIARTETGSFMNGVRDEMFGLQGLETLEWVTAGDEHVRATHVTYGASGPKPRGFDYLTLVGLGSSGALRYPGDSNAPPGETINCRCLQVPSE